MSRDYKIPNIEPGESNWDYCQRAAASIPPEAILRAIIDRIYVAKGFDGAWSFIGQCTAHGSGVSGGIVNRFVSEEAKGERKAKVDRKRAREEAREARRIAKRIQKGG